MYSWCVRASDRSAEEAILHYTRKLAARFQQRVLIGPMRH